MTPRTVQANDPIDGAGLPPLSDHSGLARSRRHFPLEEAFLIGAIAVGALVLAGIAKLIESLFLGP